MYTDPLCKSTNVCEIEGFCLAHHQGHPSSLYFFFRFFFLLLSFKRGGMDMVLHARRTLAHWPIYKHVARTYVEQWRKTAPCLPLSSLLVHSSALPTLCCEVKNSHHHIVILFHSFQEHLFPIYVSLNWALRDEWTRQRHCYRFKRRTDSVSPSSSNRAHTHRAQHIFNFIPLFHPFLTTFYYSQSSSYRILSYLISIHNNNSNFFLSFIYFNVLIKRAVGAQLLKSRPAAKKDRRRSLFFKKWIQIFSFFFCLKTHQNDFSKMSYDKRPPASYDSTTIGLTMYIRAAYY